MQRLYEFSKESVRKAEAAYELGYDVIGRESIPLNQNHSITRVYMRNTKHTAYLNKDFFPEIGPDEELAVTYIIHFERCNALIRTHAKEGTYEEPTGIKEGTPENS